MWRVAGKPGDFRCVTLSEGCKTAVRVGVWGGRVAPMQATDLDWRSPSHCREGLESVPNPQSSQAWLDRWTSPWGKLILVTA